MISDIYIWQRVKSVEKDSPPLREGNIRINGFDPPPYIFILCKSEKITEPL
jgi:hypothetical protein